MMEFNLLHAEALYVRFCAIYGDKFFKPYHDIEFKKVWYEEWVSGLAGIDAMLIKNSLEYCKTNLDWPPSIGEFRRICEKGAGFPSSSECMQLAIRGEFIHPVIAMAYDKVGSWAMKNDKEAELKNKFEKAYYEALNEFRANPQKCLAQLESFKERKAMPPPLPKIPTPSEIKSFTERLKEATKMAQEAKEQDNLQPHPTWDQAEVTYGNARFNQETYNSRRSYLIGLDERSAMRLPVVDQYDRGRYLKEDIGARMLSKNKQYQDEGKQEKVSPRPHNGPRTVYKNWMAD